MIYIDEKTIHTCGPKCPRLPCVQRRKIDALSAENSLLASTLSQIRGTFTELVKTEKQWTLHEVAKVAGHWIAKIDSLKTPAGGSDTSSGSEDQKT